MLLKTSKQSYIVIIKYLVILSMNSGINPHSPNGGRFRQEWRRKCYAIPKKLLPERLPGQALEMLWRPNLLPLTDLTIKNNKGETAYDIAKANPAFDDKRFLEMLKEAAYE